MLQKGAVEPMDQPGLGYYSRLFLVEKVTGAWRPVIDLSALNGVVMVRLDVLHRLEGRIFSDSDPPGVLTVSSLLSRDTCVSVPSVVLRPIHGSEGVHQSLHSGFRVGPLEGRASPPLPG